MHRQLIQTPVGELVAQWTSSGKLQSCGFRHEKALEIQQQSAKPQSRLLQQKQQLLEDRLTSYFTGDALEWDLEQLDWTAITEFHQRVLRACYEIPPGETTSYGELAIRAGSPRGARAVGSAMARNRWPILIPCHRVLGSSGQLTGYSGTGGLETKRWLLELESRQLSVCS